MKKLLKGIGMLSLIGVFTSLMTITVFAAGADPTGASYVIPAGGETLSDVAAIANKAYFRVEFHLGDDNRIYGFLLPMRLCHGGNRLLPQ